jgi:hypothetical protein
MHNGYADSPDGRNAKLAVGHFKQRFLALTEYLNVYTQLVTWKQSQNSFQVIFTQTKTKKGKK